MKLSIVYYSQTGNTKKIAEIIKEGVEKSGDIQVKTMSIEDMDYKFLEESKAVIFGTPTYYATFSWQIKKWFDTCKECNLSGKLGSVFATENVLGGGADVAELSLIGHMLVKGMLIYSAGSSEGQPYTHFGAVCTKDGDEQQRERARIFGERIGNKALEIFN
ncbi:flavodoxin family protein [Clostridium sp. MB40-C1]|uniref:flavodoxin family protein n=1 Tax=Clostridium sp. MB40-C1 TaxID=3070996 RepID=UPI0027E09D31|nr:flavodoxin family protein [Clostridium sp. MB40-C1]WMJ81906.1 flavodoxin family protein [Clostridium sp. MB40-C1]